MKRCPQCDTFLDESKFTKNKRLKDGLSCWCKKCTSRYRKRWASLPVNKKKLKEYDRSNARKKSRRKYLLSDKGQKMSRDRAKRHRINHPEKCKARQALRYAVRVGNIDKPCKCEVGGKNCHGQIQGHHDDYSMPLDVIWLCRYHHNMIPDWISEDAERT